MLVRRDAALIIAADRRQLVVAKSLPEDEAATLEVVKSAAEQQYTLGLAYPVNRVDASVAADGYRDFVGPEALERTAWRWMKESRDINLYHTDGTGGHATVVESYIYRGPDWTVDNTVIKAGDWMLGAVWDDHGWNLVKSGKLRGWSPEGGARRRPATADQLATLR